MKKLKKYTAFLLIFLVFSTQNPDIVAAGLGKVFSSININSIISKVIPKERSLHKTAKDDADKKKSAEYLSIEKKYFERKKELDDKLKNKKVEKQMPSTVMGTPAIIDVKSINSYTNAINWTYETNVDYQLEIDGQTIDLLSQQGYLHEFDPKFTSHTYRLRSRHDGQYSKWSMPVTKITVAGETMVDTKAVIGGTSNEQSKSNITTSQTLAATSTESTTEFPVDFYVHLKGESSDVWHKGPMEFNTTLRVYDGIRIKLVNVPTDLKVKYRGYFDGLGWSDWAYDGTDCAMIGTPMQGVQVQLEGTTNDYSIQYMLTCSDYSNAGIFGLDGTTSGYAGIDNGNTTSLVGKTCNNFNVWLINKNEYHTEFIDKDTTWSSGTYVIEGELIINPNVTLTISSGVNVNFQKYKYRENGITVKGNLIINNQTATQPVQFSYKDDGGTLSADQYSFNGINVESTGTINASNTTFLSNFAKSYIINNGSTTLDHCTFTFSSGTSDFVFDSGESSIQYCAFSNTISNNSSVAISLNTPSGKTANIKNCSFTNMGFDSLFIDAVCGKVYILDNSFKNSTNKAIGCMGGASDSGLVTISGNTIDGGQTGIELDYCQSPMFNVVFSGNTIQNCSDYGIFIGKYMGILTCQRNTIKQIDAGSQKTNSGPIAIETTNLGSNFSSIISAVNPSDLSLKNNFSGNNYNAIILRGDITSDSKLPKGTNEYIIDGDTTLAVAKTLNIEDGTLYI